MNKEKLESKSFKELIELKEVLNEIVLRTHIVSGNPTHRWRQLNELLSCINKMIEDKIYNEYFS